MSLNATTRQEQPVSVIVVILTISTGQANPNSLVLILRQINREVLRLLTAGNLQGRFRQLRLRIGI